MGIQLNKLAQFKTFVQGQAPTAPIRVRLTDTELVDLLGETGTESLRHPVMAGLALKKMRDVLDLPVPKPTEVDAMFGWSQKFREASRALWDALHGEEIDGVEILRKAS